MKWKEINFFLEITLKKGDMHLYLALLSEYFVESCNCTAQAICLYCQSSAIIFTMVINSQWSMKYLETDKSSYKLKRKKMQKVDQ